MAKKVSKPKKPAPSKPPRPSAPPAKSYILFGADEYAKPRAARFSGVDPEPLAKAAEAMHLRLVEVAGQELVRLAAKLPAGRLHASGSGLVPFVKGDVYCELVSATVGDQEPISEAKLGAQKLARTWDETEPGDLVIVKETHECGWWDAIVVERKGDLVTVKYRDFPRYPALTRHRSAVAMISLPTDQASAG